MEVATPKSSGKEQFKLFGILELMISRISTSPHETWSIAISSNQLYVGT